MSKLNRMSNLRLRFAREILGFSQSEAAEYFGGAARSWSDMESGRYAVNPEIQSAVENLLRVRLALMQQYHDFIVENGLFAVFYCENPADCGSFVDWKLNQSVAKGLCAEYFYRLIVFNRKNFRQFCIENNLSDNFKSRLFWADAADLY